MMEGFFLILYIKFFFYFLFHRYTSIGSTLNTVPNPHLKKESENGYEPAYLLKDASKERDGR